jgi:transcriptional regulator with XRE-family HTH domain
MKSIRLEKGISLAELSNLTGLEIDYLSALENGTISPTLTDFNEIAKALNVPYTDLVN